jgi:hypothetical protein
MRKAWDKSIVTVVCPYCTKPYERERKPGLKPPCTECAPKKAEKDRQHFKALRQIAAKQHPEKTYERNFVTCIKRKGVTLEWYNAQEKKCGICGKTNPGRSTTGTIKRWSIDHDHACCPAGKACMKCVRGLLCSNCNTAIGMLKDNIELLINAALWITLHKYPHLKV